VTARDLRFTGAHDIHEQANRLACDADANRSYSFQFSPDWARFCALCDAQERDDDARG
jgi:hypothetical protein